MLRGRRRRPANAEVRCSLNVSASRASKKATEFRRNAQPAKRGARANNANIATDAAPRNGSKGPTNAQLSARGDDYPKHFHQARPHFADNSGRDGNGALYAGVLFYTTWRQWFNQHPQCSHLYTCQLHNRLTPQRKCCLRASCEIGQSLANVA